ncbi:MAG: ArsR/SmtB family transcription factor [Paracoccaceae bacterium]
MEYDIQSDASNDLGACAAAAAFAALGSEVRLGILRQLVRAGPEGLAVGAIQDRLGIAASTLSHHIRALTGAGVLIQTREGRILNCHADFNRISALAGFLISECCVDSPGEMEGIEREAS